MIIMGGGGLKTIDYNQSVDGRGWLLIVNHLIPGGDHSSSSSSSSIRAAGSGREPLIEELD